MVELSESEVALLAGLPSLKRIHVPVPNFRDLLKALREANPGLRGASPSYWAPSDGGADSAAIAAGEESESDHEEVYRWKYSSWPTSEEEDDEEGSQGEQGASEEEQG